MSISVVLQISAMSHICYFRKKYKQQDNTVYSIQIPPTADEENVRSIPNPVPDLPRINRTRYNQILFEVSTMLAYVVILISLICILKSTQNSKTALNIKYILDLLIVFVVNVMLPITFFISNRNARMYIKGLFKRHE